MVPVVTVPELKVLETGVCSETSTSGIRWLMKSGRPRSTTADLRYGRLYCSGRPDQDARIELGIDVAAVGIDADSRTRAGDRVADLTRDRERPRPAHARRKIAEAFAEIKRRRVDGEAFGADGLRAAAAPFDFEAD